MNKLLIFPILFSLIVAQVNENKLTQEKEYEYNKQKISVKSFTSGLIINELNYTLTKGYSEEISLSEFLRLYDDDELFEYITNNKDRISKNNNKKWIYFTLGISLLALAQDSNGRVIEGVRLPAILSFLLFGYYHISSDINNNDLLSLMQVNDMVDMYNQRLLNEIKISKILD
tara:strand:+ start:150 stop:668 length:519 start_codon:yes stop_codon:yes gene_type:complete